MNENETKKPPAASRCVEPLLGRARPCGMAGAEVERGREYNMNENKTKKPPDASRRIPPADNTTQLHDCSHNGCSMMARSNGFCDDHHDTALMAWSPSNDGKQQPSILSNTFGPPIDLIYSGGFYNAKYDARTKQRWLLVNIQNKDVFACHNLNRDVWQNEGVQNLIQASFIFWQTLRTSVEGERYCQQYKVKGYPHISIINPFDESVRFRKEEWTQTKPLTAQTLEDIVSKFVNEDPIESKHQPIKSCITNGGNNVLIHRKREVLFHRKREGEEEHPDIQAAIHSSLQDGKSCVTTVRIPPRMATRSSMKKKTAAPTVSIIIPRRMATRSSTKEKMKNVSFLDDCTTEGITKRRKRRL
ncbi:UAS domain-containing protein [Skeletonema marinoi]|uniref:UAS domain-containing protein n=1 Tax=Skeletonema marinoi TaxID=267567 RepID=A0AAD8XU59_9STRA|nr:UAS domain-containing protein [Skeletonema marinoi]